MTASSETSRHIVLVGAGHAHLWVAGHAGRLRRRGARVTLVAPEPTWYSGMATGVLGGRYTPAEDQIDPAAVALYGGAGFVRDAATGFDPASRSVTLASGDTLTADLVSFAVGSTVDALPGPDDGPAVWPVKPIARLADLRARLEERFRTREPARIVVVGAGATGCEVTANLLALARRCRHRPEVTLLGRAGRILPEGPAGAAEALAAHLGKRGAILQPGTTASAVDATGVVTDAGHVPAEHVVLATGLRAHPLMQSLGLPAHPEDGLRVGSQLHSVSDPRVFAVGDCAAFEPRRLPRVGVFGVRQAPVLLNNLGASLAGRRLQDFRPQARWLSILNLGNGRALALRGDRWALGRWPMRLKDRLDRGFVNAYR